MKTIVTKCEFAAMKGRKPSALSNWIADGKITAAALVGSGVRARIWVEQAERDLARSLDPSQQIAQERPISLTAPAASGEAWAAPVAAPQSSLPVQAEDEDLRRRRRADAETAEHNAEFARLRNEKEAGRWVVAAEAQKAFARKLSEFTGEVETWATQKLARELADRHGLDWRKISADVRAAWRTFRGEEADAAERRDDDGGGEAPDAPV